jgi:serine/threonine-protein kinase
MEAQDPSGVIVSQPYSVAPAEWRRGDPTPTPTPSAMRTPMPMAPARASRLPWIIATFSVLAAATTGILLYTKLSEKKPTPAPAATVDAPAVVMAENHAPEPTSMPSAAPTPMAAPVALEGTKPAEPAPEPVAAEPVAAEPEGSAIAPPKVESAPPKKADAGTPKKVAPKHVVKTEPKAVEPKLEAKAPAGPPGMITIDSAPVYAVIYIDGKKIGETPLVNIKLAPGKHAVRAVSPTGATKSLAITIESGKTAPVRKISW